ncbi:MAG: BrnT family toxin [Clostridiales bacterium]|nr:BrnT family toxin [Clostridiales bacterium]MBO4580590.1 BrnT family toxin [Clostridiales bacterium]
MYLFTWDDKKDEINQKKHGVSFEEAKTVFYDEDALVEFDESHSDREERFRILGYSNKGNLLLVVHCVRESSIIRIISSRKASNTEKQNYDRRMLL